MTSPTPEAADDHREALDDHRVLDFASVAIPNVGRPEHVAVDSLTQVVEERSSKVGRYSHGSLPY